MCFKKKYKVFQRFYKYKGIWDRLLLTTFDKKIANEIAKQLTDKGLSKDGRRDYEGRVN